MTLARNKMYYLPGQRDWFKFEKIRWWSIGLIIGLLSGLILGYSWSYKVNVPELLGKIEKQHAQIKEFESRPTYEPKKVGPERKRMP